MKKLLIVICFFLLICSFTSFVSIYAQTTQENNQTGETNYTQQQQPPPLPEITPSPRSKLEIIQYILLPFAIGTSIWLILRLDKLEQEEEKGKNLEN